MDEKNTVGFDILENAELETIDRIGTDSEMLDEKTKKRILEMTRKRYNDAINSGNSGIYDNTENIVENVEVYSRKKSTKIIMSVVNTAAVLGLAVGSVFLVKNLGRGNNNPDNPLIPPDSTSVGTTETDIETAAVNALDYLVATDEFISSLDYAQIDMNGDNVPELIAQLHYGPYSKVCIFHYADGKYNFVEQLIHCSDEPLICLDEKRIYTFDYECDYDYEFGYGFNCQSYSTWDDELNFTEGDKLERVWGLNEDNTFSYLLNGEIISEDEYKNKSENFVTGTKADVEFKNFYDRYSYMDEVGMTDEERIIRESIFEVIDYRNDPSYTKTFNANEDVYKIRYGFIDLNGDSVDEMIILEDFVGASYINIAYLNGNVYSSIMMGNSEEIRYDAEKHKMYTILDDIEGYKTIIVDYLEGYDFLEYDSGESSIPHDWYSVSFTDDGGYIMYICNNEPCDRAEYEAALAEFEACPEFKVDYTTYSVKYLSENPVQNQPVGLTQEETARNQRIEEYIDELYNQYNVTDEEQFYNCLEIKYAYLDINNDSVSELLISYDFIEAAADAAGIGLNYFDGSKYIPMETMANGDDMKFDLQNRRLYDLVEGHENGYSLFIKTWENVEISHESDFFILRDFYYSGIDPFIGGTGEHVYLRDNEPCTKEEYEKAMAEYENCVGAELNFIPYTVKRESAEKTARDKRLEDEVQDTFKCYEKVIVDLSVDDLKIDYAYLDINNDSVDELFIRSKVLDVPESESTIICFFNGTEYISFIRIVVDEFKFDLQNRKYYEILKANDDDTDYFTLRISTWENVEFSDGDQDALTYFTRLDTYEEGGRFYLHDYSRCTKEEYDKAIAEYENCVGAELNFIPYTVKKSSGDEVQTPNNEETIQTTIAATNKPTQEILDKARDAALEARFDKHDKNNFVSMYYAYYDINDDSVPELIIDNEFNLHWEMEIYKFNSTDFEFKTSVEHTQGVILCKSEKSIEGHAKKPSMVTNICYYNDELEFGSVDKWILGYNYDENGNMYDEYKHNDTVITEEEYRAHVHKCDNCVFFNDVEFLLYQTNNPQGNEEIARERLFTNKYSPRDYSTTYYAHTDLNSDGKSELVVLCRDENNIETVEMYSFNGDEYVSLFRTTGIFKLDLANNRLFSGFADGDDIKYIVVKTWDSECNLTTLKSISQTDEGFKETVAEYEACKGVNLEYNQCW